jgi:hypothetical protein
VAVPEDVMAIVIVTGGGEAVVVGAYVAGDLLPGVSKYLVVSPMVGVSTRMVHKCKLVKTSS